MLNFYQSLHQINKSLSMTQLSSFAGHKTIIGSKRSSSLCLFDDYFKPYVLNGQPVVSCLIGRLRNLKGNKKRPLTFKLKTAPQQLINYTKLPVKW
jgi:hypothetical protein